MSRRKRGRKRGTRGYPSRVGMTVDLLVRARRVRGAGGGARGPPLLNSAARRYANSMPASLLGMRDSTDHEDPGCLRAMNHLIYLECQRAVNDLYKRGGSYQRAAERVEGVFGRISIGEDPLRGLTVTGHGENRIRHCVKYELPGRCRLVTVQHNGYCILVYCGDHPSIDHWLETHRGLVPVVTGDNVIQITYVGDQSSTRPKVGGGRGHTAGPLYSRLPEDLFDLLTDGLHRRVVRGLEELDSAALDEQLWVVLNDVPDLEQRGALRDVLSLLRQDKTREAAERARLFAGDTSLLVDQPESALPELIDSDVIRRISPGSSNYGEAMRRFIKSARYRDWMLFLHPEQEKVVAEDFDGPAKLVGVSGSGKTCVVVQRAVRMARRYPRERILVLTLNRALAHLICDLVEAVATDEEKRHIDVVPLFALCQLLLKQFEPKADMLYEERTWKINEHVDEIWQEYYRCEANNYDARAFQPAHDMLIARGWNAERYLREEVDWLRSAVPATGRDRYLTMSRTGRQVPLLPQFRQAVVEGTAGWEQKMADIGVTDGLGIAQALLRHIHRVAARYRCVLVDEAQDFGNVELSIVRRLVEPGENDLFLCGDAAQAVTTKFQSLRSLGIEIPGHRSRRLALNYRNSRDVLQAAYAVLAKNLTEELMDREDFDILDPEYSAFSAATPLILRAESLEQEIACAMRHAASIIADKVDGKACLAVCGYTLYELQKFGERVKLPVLDGASSIDSGRLFISDLEQTKGFEFDAVIVINASAGALPNPTAPQEEHFRDLARLYVAMTRAKTDLILSWSGQVSPFLAGVEEHFLQASWTDYLDQLPEGVARPKQLEAHREFGMHRKSWRRMTGEQFLYSEWALGLQPELIAKVRELVNGLGVRRGRFREKWITMGDAADDFVKFPQVRRGWGPETGQGFRSLIDRLVAAETPAKSKAALSAAGRNR